MARIPLSIASSRLETGQPVNYSGVARSPVGAALEGFGADLSAAAENLRQKDEQQAGFKARVLENEFSAGLATLDSAAERDAPEDGAGIHDSVYGQIDPVSKKAVKPGSFDTLFNQYLERMPQSQRPMFEAKRDLYRTQGSNRLAAVQLNAEQQYYRVETQKVQSQITNAMLQADPNDTATYEGFKKQGADIIRASRLPALEKDVALANWDSKASETLFQAKLAKDPSFASQARAALGLGATQPSAGGVEQVVDRIIGAESGGRATARNPNSTASGVGQFLDSTWVATVRRHRPDIAEGKSAAQILALKTDPSLGREMTVAYTKDNAEYLTNRGVPTTPGNIYLAHFLGPAGAVQALKADPSASVVSIVGQDVVRANQFLAGKTVSDLVSWADKKMGGEGKPVPIDPAFAAIPAERRLQLANQADVQIAQIERDAAASQKAGYIAYKDAFELSVVNGQIKDEAVINSDGVLNDGDKASLIRSVRTQNETTAQLQSDLASFNSQGLTLDPYASKDKTRADNLYNELSKQAGSANQGAVAGAIIQQTGVVPQPVLNSIRRGLSSQTPADVAAAAQLAQQISSSDSAALGRRDGGSEVQKTADDFSYYVNQLNLTPEEAARRLIEDRDPQKQRERKALEPAAKEFLKAVEGESLPALFDDAWFSDPAVGFNTGAEYGIKAEFQALAQDRFYSTNGNAELALNQAKAEMQRLYGVTRIAGRAVVMKHPPEKYWPGNDTSGIGATLAGANPLDYAKQQLENSVREADATYAPGSISLVTTPETDADVKAGRLPGYAVMWKDQNGAIQTIPGKVWRPDISVISVQRAARQEREAREAASRAAATVDTARELDADIRAGRDRDYTIDQYLDGNPLAPAPRAPLPDIKQPTTKDRLDERREELFENAPDLTPTPWGAM